MIPPHRWDLPPVPDLFLSSSFRMRSECPGACPRGKAGLCRPVQDGSGLVRCRDDGLHGHSSRPAALIMSVAWPLLSVVWPCGHPLVVGPGQPTMLTNGAPPTAEYSASTR